MISVYPNLDPLLFDYLAGREHPMVNALAKKQIMMDIGSIFAYIPVKWCVLTGDALKYSGETTELKVVVGVDDQVLLQPEGQFIQKGVNAVLGKLNQPRLINGTRHPVKYLITTKPYTSYKFKDAYAFMDDRWLSSSYQVVSEKIQVKRPTSRRQYMMNVFRGLDRKNPDLIPDIYQTKKSELLHAKIPIERAKNSDTGIWRISRLQALEIARHYHLSHLPKRLKPFKMLGNTRVMLFRPKKNVFFLLKGPYVKRIKNKFRHISYA